MPERIQRRRTKGWRMPEGAVYVGRPSRWGNPVKVGGPCCFFDGERPHVITVRATLDEALRYYRLWLWFRIAENPDFLAPLRGHDLVCWCPLVDRSGAPWPCHADILLELANA